MGVNNLAIFAEIAGRDLYVWENLIDCEITHKSYGVGIIDDIESRSGDKICIKITFFNLFDINKTKTFNEMHFLEGDFINIDFDLSLFSGFNEFLQKKERVEKEEKERLIQEKIIELHEINELVLQQKKEIEELEQTLNKIKEKQFDDIKKAFDMYQIRSLWYICHIQSLYSIVSRGIYCRNRAIVENIDSVDISDMQVQSRRRQFHQYVNLYFADNTPMLYKVCEKYSDKVILLELDPVKVIKGKLRFTDGNAASSDTLIYEDIGEFNKLNWAIIKGRGGAFSRDNKRIRSAEVLIVNHVEADSIKCIHVQSSEYKLQSQGILEDLSRDNINVKIDLNKYGIRG